MIHHSNCGMELFDNQVIQRLLASSLKTARYEGGVWKDPGGGASPAPKDATRIDWLTIRDQPESVTEDVTRIRQHPLVPRDIPIYGYIYQVESGRLVEVPRASEVGRAG